MDSKRIIQKIKVEHPGKTIICDPEENPTEIICEIDPTSEHPEKSVALAVVGMSKLHYHKKSTEIYKVIKGQLTVIIDSKKHKLKEGEKITIKPGEIHSAVGEETWFLIYSKPGWRFDDHIIVEK